MRNGASIWGMGAMTKDLPVHLRNDFVGVIVAFFSALQITTWCWGH
jgi:hypothetical protein